jgi:sugar lactone lactonase YvrE
MRILLTVLIALVFTAFLLNWNDSYTRHELTGTAVAYTKGFPFVDGQHAEILQNGLSEARGLAVDERGQSVFVAESNRPLEVYQTDAASMDSLEPACLEGPCTEDDRRGVAEMDGTLYLAEHGRARIVAGDVSPAFAATMLIATESTTGPTGISVTACNVDNSKPNSPAKYSVFYTDDRPWPGKPTANGPYDSADYSRWVDTGSPRPLGGLYNCNVENSHCEPTLIADSLPHPSGVAAASAVGPVFVAEADSREVRWPIYTTDDSHAHWTQSGSLGSVPVSSGSAPAFLGIVLDDSHNFIFAAGPGGVHVFSFSGDELGVIQFEDSVTGMATRGSKLYLVVGRSLCQLDLQTHFNKFPRPSCVRSPGIAGQVGGTSQNAPTRVTAGGNSSLPRSQENSKTGGTPEPAKTQPSGSQNEPTRITAGGNSSLPRSQENSKTGGTPEPAKTQPFGSQNKPTRTIVGGESAVQRSKRSSTEGCTCSAVRASTPPPHPAR